MPQNVTANAKALASWAIIRLKAKVPILSLFVGILCWVLVFLFRNLCLSRFAIILMGKRG